MSTLPEADEDASVASVTSALNYLADPIRLAALERSGLWNSPAEAAFDRLTQLAQRVLNAPIILISLVDDQRQFFKSGLGLSEPLASARQTSLTHSFCKHVVATRQPFQVNDARTDPRVMHNGAAKDFGAVSYLGLPLTDLDGEVIGSFCAIDGKPRQWSEEDRDALRDFASLTMTETELRAALKEARDAQTALTHSNRLLRQVTEAAPSIIYLYDLPTRTNVYANRSIETILGYTADEIALMNEDVIRLVHPEDMPLVEQHLAGFVHRADGEHQELEYRARNKAGRWRWLRSRETVFERDEDGRPRLILGVAEDFSQRRQTESDLRDTAAELQRSNQALQEFASVASHDLQEPLRKILAFGDRLRIKVGPTLESGSQDYLERMLSAAERMQTLINDLLQFSRVTSKALPFSAVDLVSIVDGVLSDLEAQMLRTGGKVEVGCLPTITADPLQMRQLFQNLIGNALKFGKPGIAPCVRLCAEVQSGVQKSTVRICVQDNGIGFDDRYADRIFEVFERLNRRGEYEGNGIGLAICRRILERHGGSIEAQGVPGEGARFTVVLPTSHYSLSNDLPVPYRVEG